jgi:protein-S-isoprenylcysteine O-methyltransferase Ste14
MNSLYLRAARQLLQLPIVMGVLLFLPAGTFDYWQAWAFIVVFFACTVVITVYLAVKDPKLLKRRMSVGPTVEKEKTQKLIVVLLVLSIIGVVVAPALDHRFSWSHVPTPLVFFGDILVVLGFVAMFFVLRPSANDSV